MFNLTPHVLEEMVDTIVHEVDPEQVYLFGSCVRGGVDADSDIDLLIVEKEDFGPDRSRWRELQRVRRSLARFRVPKDIVVYSLKEVEKWKNSLNHIVAHALREGRLVYERP